MMDMLLWIAGGLASALIGALAVAAAIRQRPQRRIALIVVLNLLVVALIFALDVEPPPKITTWHYDGSALTSAAATLAWLLRAGLSGAALTAIAMRLPEPPPVFRRMRKQPG